MLDWNLEPLKIIIVYEYENSKHYFTIILCQTLNLSARFQSYSGPNFPVGLAIDSSLSYGDGECYLYIYDL